MKQKLYFYFTSNVHNWLDFLFYGITGQKKQEWLAKLKSIEFSKDLDSNRLDQLHELEQAISVLPNFAGFRMRMQNEILLIRRKLDVFPTHTEGVRYVAEKVIRKYPLEEKN